MNKFLSPAIGSTTTLIHIFIILLFFENFFIITGSKSLLDISIDFEEIKLKPFIVFFFFLAVSKLLWFIIQTVLQISSIVHGDDTQNTTAHKSYITFVLPILITSYMILIELHPENSPINIKTHFWYYKLYTAFWFLIAVFSFLRFIYFKPESFMNEKTEVK